MEAIFIAQECYIAVKESRPVAVENWAAQSGARPPTLKKKMRILREISDNVRQTILAGSGKASSSVQAKPNNRKPGSESLPPTF
jgi:hypothetical protein